MRVRSYQLLLHDNYFSLPSQDDLTISYFSFSSSPLYFSVVFEKWKQIIMKITPTYFHNKENEAMFFAWIEKHQSYDSVISFWMELVIFLKSFQKLVTVNKIEEFFSTLKQMWSVVSVASWKDLTKKQILTCNIEKIHNATRIFWVIIYQDTETNHYLIDKECFKIIQKSKKTDFDVDFILFTNGTFRHAGKAKVLFK